MDISVCTHWLSCKRTFPSPVMLRKRNGLNVEGFQTNKQKEWSLYSSTFNPILSSSSPLWTAVFLPFMFLFVTDFTSHLCLSTVLMALWKKMLIIVACLLLLSVLLLVASMLYIKSKRGRETYSPPATQASVVYVWQPTFLRLFPLCSPHLSSLIVDRREAAAELSVWVIMNTCFLWMWQILQMLVLLAHSSGPVVVFGVSKELYWLFCMLAWLK